MNILKNVKRRSLVLDLITYYSRDAQREWIKLSFQWSYREKCKSEKDVQITFLRGRKFKSHEI